MQGRVAQRPDADGNVGALLQQVDVQVIRVELRVDLGNSALNAGTTA